MMHLHHHLDLLLRSERSLALKEVIERIVRPGARVCDAGTGTGILAVWSALAGAREVVGVDMSDIALARALAEENGVGDRVRFVRGDLASLGPEDLGGRFDAITALLYYNDPRRDETQSRLSLGLYERLLEPNGERIRDRVEYAAFGLDWPSQDVRARLRALGRQRRELETSYGLRLGPFFDALRETPQPGWFPARGDDGALRSDGARALSDEKPFTTIEYATGVVGYPATLELEIAEPGTLTAVTWIQSLHHRDIRIFTNESVSWVHPVLKVQPGDRVTLAIDDDWRRTNRLSPLPTSDTHG